MVDGSVAGLKQCRLDASDIAGLVDIEARSSRIPDVGLNDEPFYSFQAGYRETQDCSSDPLHRLCCM